MKTITKTASFVFRFLLVSLSLGASCAFAQTLEESRQAVKAQKQVVHSDREKLKSDVTAYGKHSEQAKADRTQLRNDRMKLEQARSQAHAAHKKQG